MKDIEVPRAPKNRAERVGGLVIAILAIIMTVVSATEHSIEGEIKIAEKQEDDQWIYYQSKGMKASLSQMTHDLLTLLSTTSSDDAKAAIAKHAKSVERYAEDQTEIAKEAKFAAAKAAALSSKKGRLALVETLVQIAIGACSIFIATAVRPFFWVGGCVAVVALTYYAFVLIAY